MKRFVLVAFCVSIHVVRSLELTSDLEVWDAGSDCDVSQCVLVEAECDFPAALSYHFHLNPLVSQTLSLSESAVPTALCCCVNSQKSARMNLEGPPIKAVPEAVRNRPTPQSARLKSGARMVKEQSAASTRRDAIAADSDVTWPTDGSAS